MNHETHERHEKNDRHKEAILCGCVIPGEKGQLMTKEELSRIGKTLAHLKAWECVSFGGASIS